MNVETEIRKLARSTYWQALYSAGQDGINVGFFINNDSLSGLQILLLQWIQTYNSVYTDLAKKESMFLTNAVIVDDIRCDAYLCIRRKKNAEEWFNHQQDEKKAKIKSKHKFKKDGNISLIDVDLRREPNA